MLGDLIPAKDRTLGSAYVTTVCGFGTLASLVRIPALSRSIGSP